MLELRDYQRRSLDALAEYLRLTADDGPKRAFIALTERPYHPVAGIAEVPYVCLRVPTGGGKTLMACHAAKVAAREYLHVDQIVCLWLVPSNTIRDQTISALKNRQHPYRQEVEAAFRGNIHVMDLTEALYINRGDLAGATCFVVTTIQSLRVEDTDGRKVYETNGNLQAHFSDLNPMMRSLLETEGDGRIIYSLANVLRSRRPVIIMDEAHNARTSLSFDTLARFRPSCVIEFTATPQMVHDPEHGLFASNVLHHVSARELKEAEMIKLPIRLRTRTDWREVVGEAIATRKRLEELADEECRETGEYLRPIVLVQAQPATSIRESITVDVLNRTLINEFSIPEEQIAIATGEKRGIEGVDLFDPNCPIRFIITVKALAEGWDCSFAYILCTVSEVSTARSVEQVLGRILRMPRARRKTRADLNCAYTFAASTDFVRTAASLCDALVEGAGFQKLEAADLVTHDVASQGILFEPGSLFDTAPQRPSFPEFRVPLLSIRVNGQLELFEEDHFLDYDWSLAECDANLSASEFEPLREAGTAEIDVNSSGHVEMQTAVEEVRQQLWLLSKDAEWNVENLTRWLDANIPHDDLPQNQTYPYIYKIVSNILSDRRFTISHLGRYRFHLSKAIAKRIDKYRHDQRFRAHQQILFSEAAAPIEVSAELCLIYDETRYDPNWPYEGLYQFQKHLFPRVGELKSEGEEFDCARLLDQSPHVEVWVRNLERRLKTSFWLQTPTDRFYPDFLACLVDGRILAVEYKGLHLWSNDDSKEKRAIGDLWAKKSDGRCLFVMPEGPQWSEITDAINKAVI